MILVPRIGQAKKNIMQLHTAVAFTGPLQPENALCTTFHAFRTLFFELVSTRTVLGRVFAVGDH